MTPKALILLLLLSPLTIFSRGVDKVRIDTSPTHLYFIENKGQIVDENKLPRHDIQFKVSIPNMEIFLGEGQLHYQWNTVIDSTIDSAKNNTNDVFGTETQEETRFFSYRLDVTLIGANKNAIISKEERHYYYENYYLPQCIEGTVANTFTKVTYKDIYPKIDWVLYCKDNELKYDFVVHPGGDVNKIKLKYSGASSLELKDGAIVAKTIMGSITEQKPYTYDLITGKLIPSSFSLDGDVVSFNVGNYNGAIVIDPMLKWATYYGGNSVEDSKDILTDASGNVFFCGKTHSPTNIATSGTHQSVFTIDFNAYLVKFSVDGIRLWGTYYGGCCYDRFHSLDCDSLGNIFVGGIAQSDTGIATAGAFKTSKTGIYDAFLVKFNLSGVRQWATYIGGDNFQNNAVVKCDKSGNVILGGYTYPPYSTPFPTTVGAHQVVYGGDFADGFVSKFNTNGSLLWSTYYGGNKDDRINQVTTDENDNVYALGYTWSPNAISTAGSSQGTLGGSWDAFLVKFNPSGIRKWATYFGGAGLDYGLGLDYDGASNIYIGGTTSSTSNITSGLSSYQTSNAGGTDAFIAKFDTAGNKLWSTYYGGSSNDSITAISVSRKGSIYLTGTTRSNNGIASPGAFKTAYAGNQDIFLCEFDSSGVRKWGTYYGGPSTDFSYSIYSGRAGNLLVSGETSSSSSIASPNGFHTSLFGTNDAFITCFNIDTAVYIVLPYMQQKLCLGDSITVDYGVSAKFSASNVFTLQLSDATGSFANPSVLQTLYSDTSGTFSTILPNSTVLGNKYRLRVLASSPPHVSEDNYVDIEINSIPQKPEISSNSPICDGDTLFIHLDSLSIGASTKISGPLSFISYAQDTFIANTSLGNIGSYIVYAERNGCISDQDSTTVVVYPLDTPSVQIVANVNNVHPATKIVFSSTALNGGSNPLYQWIKNGNPIAGATLDTYTGTTDTDIFSGDTIALEMVSTAQCPNPKEVLSNKIIVVVNLGVADKQTGRSIEVYPNPNSGCFTVKGALRSSGFANLLMATALGETVYSTVVKTHENSLNTSLTLNEIPPGLYILHVIVDDLTYTVPISIVK